MTGAKPTSTTRSKFLVMQPLYRKNEGDYREHEDNYAEENVCDNRESPPWDTRIDKQRILIRIMFNQRDRNANRQLKQPKWLSV